MKKNHNKPWTKEEDEILMSNLTASAKSLSKQILRSPEAIQVHKRRLIKDSTSTPMVIEHQVKTPKKTYSRLIKNEIIKEVSFVIGNAEIKLLFK